ncbi:hypothetical protein BW723_08600 [Polaribacter reichenbachii]|uniref:Competence protein n=1 Tax=Polaribacter reichenbachii TaxID=996801 RepID=A0A1B8U734_9FLAO|nr:hypothetical protein [Polaribacter reichenbachii]APZ46352.1 hypothetical protein BW723_08600 [Polaribacter reichenbachii]AUC20216.1 hypothetical protein BTO17_16630 [Polaribacter reichenbachii]OBY67693.1 hypothetical protein LPB301_00900 [Polaribacter reichenbachii]
MNIFEAFKSNSEEGVDAGKDYVNASFEYGKLKTFQILTYSLSAFTKLLLIGSLLGIGVIFVSVAGAIALGNYLGNIALGHLIVGLFLAFLGFLIYLLRKRIIDKKIISEMSNQFFKSEK